jgi:hypothetical protein
MKRGITALFIFFLGHCFSQAELTLTIGYPDHPDYFIYSIPYSDENARMGGEYYVKIENTGTIDLNSWQLTMNWKTLNSTWGVVNKTVLNSSTGLIRLEGPSWDVNLAVGESIILNGEWIATGSIQDWIDYLPTNSTCSAVGYSSVPIVFDSQGPGTSNSYSVTKVLPIDASRKTFSEKKVIAYFPLFDAERALCSLKKYGKNIDELRVQMYSISTDGKLRAGQDLPAGYDPFLDIDYWFNYVDSLGVLDYCVANSIEFVPVVYNYNSTLGDFDQQAVHLMLTNSSLRTQHLTDLDQLLQLHSEFAGIDIDYESLMATERDNYAAFMEDLAIVVHAQNKILTTAVHTKVGPGTWYGPLAQDFKRIGNAVDEFTLMTYDLHWATSPTFSSPPPTAGCQGTPDWMNDVAFFSISEIDDPSKIQLGLPFYGYRWKQGFENHTLSDPGVGLTYEDAMELYNNNSPQSVNRESNGKEMNFVVNLGGVNWVCYYQDSTSLAYKLTALLENDLNDYIGGVAVWRLGGEDQSMWNSFIQSVKSTSAIIEEVDCSTTLNEQKEIKIFELSIYPNPSFGKLNIESNELIEKIEIFTLDGKQVLSYQIPNQKVIEMSIDFLVKGTYLLKVASTSSRKQIKLTIN